MIIVRAIMTILAAIFLLFLSNYVEMEFLPFLKMQNLHDPQKKHS